ncbi:MAG: sigma-54-dependent Fis family transcriptional regulator [Alphaproteobacteria bacterium]|nr:MAG: sigma-54-dependent Fis family transcriptional regulator [Alphaproteobacteria bacterium]TAF38652.1 MAG: sigma-54-dependent Fis family transcriptional regulator [Alphaproteobacteria bacterium]TAF76294.1 MAG: sigma-54-dependent Fis family transcriptional regulator [Alphaproteobacteria bacterium]
MRVMIVGTMHPQLSAATTIAAARGAKVTHCVDTATALNALCDGKGADMIMVDVHEDIASFIHALRSERIAAPVIACGAVHDKEAAVNAIRAGAKEYIPLPPDEDLIAAVLESYAQEQHSVLFRSDVMKSIITMADQVAKSDASVLITGDSGTGKEVIAHYLHAQSRRTERPFISVNCAAIPENLLESELFGHEKGAFTGALNRRVGKFEEADRGTLLLDEISEMDLRLQAKLLRALQEREIDRVGGTKPVKIDIRVIATSNRNMLDAIRKGTFREDLYYRLNVIHLMLPPLRERGEDTLVLAEHFIQKYSQNNGIKARLLTDAAKDKLLAYHWPGNVRELENTMHRAVLMARGDEIDHDALQLVSATLIPFPQPAPKTAPINDEDDDSPDVGNLVGRTVAEVEKELILQTLDHCLGNRTHAANILGISIRTLRNKLRLYEGIDFHPTMMHE